MQRRGGESGGRGVSKYSRKTYSTPSHRVSSAAELIQSALMSKMIAWRAKCDHTKGEIDTHKTAEAKET